MELAKETEEFIKWQTVQSNMNYTSYKDYEVSQQRVIREEMGGLGFHHIRCGKK